MLDNPHIYTILDYITYEWFSVLAHICYLYKSPIAAFSRVSIVLGVCAKNDRLH